MLNSLANHVADEKKSAALTRSSALPKQAFNNWGLKCVQNWDEQMLKIEERGKVSQAKLLSERQRNYTFQKSKLPPKQSRPNWPMYLDIPLPGMKAEGEEGDDGIHGAQDPEYALRNDRLAKALGDHSDDIHSPAHKEPHHPDGMRDYQINNIHKIINVMDNDKGLTKNKEEYRVG